MSRINKKVKLLILVILIPVLFLVIEQTRTFIALNDYSMLPTEVKIVDRIELGREKRRFERGSIVLACTNRGNILLIAKTHKHQYVGPGASDKAFLIIGSSLKGGEVEIKRIEFVSDHYFDTLVSDPLSQSEINSIINALKTKQSSHVSLSTLDGGNAFPGDATASSVRTLVNNCTSSSDN
jgi:hypothetical protein